MLPRIDPLELLKCLSVLLSPSGGIRSASEVERVARLMSRYSKKLVSKCIYVQVLKSTSPDLLDLFLKEGGWTLVVTWLQESMQTNNLPLVLEVLQLLQLCPINADRLKEFDSSLIRRLALESTDINVRTAASEVWSTWFPQLVDNTPTLQTLPLQNMHMPPHQADLADNLPIPDDMALLNDLFDPNFTFPAQPSGGLDAETVFDLSSIDPSFTFDNVTAQQYQPEPQTTPLPVIPPPVALSPVTTPTVASEPPPQPPTTGTLPVLKIVARGGKYSVTSEMEPSSQSAAEMGENKEKEKGKSDKGRSSGSQSSSSSKSKDKVKEKSRDRSKDGKRSSSVSSSSSSTQKDKDRDRKSDKHSKSSKDKSKHKSSSSSKSSSSKEEKPKEAKQAEKDKETLAALKAMTAPASDGLTKLAKIPKKPKVEGEEVKILASDPTFDPLALLDKSKPKTVKTFNSKFRSIGLEEGAGAAATVAKPVAKKIGMGEKKTALGGLPAISATKRPPEMNLFASVEKKIKPAMLLEKKDENLAKREEKGGIKLIAPRPRPAVLQDSSLFGDALDAGAKSEPRRKRRRSSDSKKEAPSASPNKKSPPSSSSPPPPPIESALATDLPGNVSPVLSPTVVKPQLKFYQDTLDTQNADEEKAKEEDENLEMPVLTKETEEGAGEDANGPKEGKVKEEAGEEEDGSTAATGEKGVLCITTQRTKPKKTLRWREDEDLLQFHYFELDETERVNVNKLQFGDLKQADRKNEREAFERARRMDTEDGREEKVPWKPLAPLSLPHSEFVPGANSREKDIQAARESSTLPMLFLNRQLLPDSPAEPDPEVPLERPTDPISIPFDDVTGNPESVYDLRHIPWPEPKTSRMGGPPGDSGYLPPPGSMMMDMAPPMIPTIPVAPVNPMDESGAMHMMTPPHMGRTGGGGPHMDAYAPPTGPPRGGGWMAGDGSVFPDTDNRYPPYDDGRGYGPPGREGMMPEGGVGGVSAGNYGGGYEDMEMENRNFVQMTPGNMPNMPMGPGRGMGMGMDGPRFRGGPGFGPNMGPRRPGPPMGGPPQGMGGPRGMNPGGVSPCWHFMRGYCRMENKCKFLHPGYTG